MTAHCTCGRIAHQKLQWSELLRPYCFVLYGCGKGSSHLGWGQGVGRIEGINFPGRSGTFFSFEGQVFLNSREAKEIFFMHWDPSMVQLQLVVHQVLRWQKR